MHKSEKDEIFRLCDEVRIASLGLHKFLRYGHLERVYRKGLMNRLLRSGHRVQEEQPLVVWDETGEIIGEFFADLVVDDVLLVELKALRTLTPEHTAQILGYLRASRFQHGLLVNFGAPRLEIRKLFLYEQGTIER